MLLSTILLLHASAQAAEEQAPRPRWVDQPPDPYAQTDYTAYTLDFGEVGIGPRSVGVGILPGVQVTTQPLIDLAGVTNLAAKLDLLTVGSFDLAVNGSFGHRHQQPFNALLVTSGGNASLILAPKVSVHLGAEWISFAAVGEPDVGPLSALVPEVETIPQQTLHLLESRLAYEIRVQSVVASVATDIRFNRRDSLLIQAAAPIWAWTKLPSWMDKYGGEERGFLDLGECWSAGLAWQAHYRNLDIRVGIGLSSVPGSWIVQTTDLRWRFGGSKRREFRKGLHQWRSGETP